MAEETDKTELRIGRLQIFDNEPEGEGLKLKDGHWYLNGVRESPSTEDFLNSAPLPPDGDDEDIDDDYVPCRGPRSDSASRATVNSRERSDFFSLEVGEESERGLEFVAFKLIKRYPYSFVGKADQGEVEAWFKLKLLAALLNSAIVNRGEHIVNQTRSFYLQDPNGNKDPLLLIPSVQFEQFLKFTNQEIGTKLTIPHGEARPKFFLTFGDSNTPLPRFLGCVHSEKAYEDLRSKMYGLPQDKLSDLSPGALQSFKGTMEKAYRIVGSKKKSPEAARMRKVERQKDHGRMTKRVQRYLGLRARAAYASHSASAAADWNVEKPAPFITDSSVRFVSVDVEAYEKNADIVTEIGLSVLDTDDIMDIPPGEDGENWFSKIKTYHLRIAEYSYIVNREYVEGCPYMFRFGESEIVPLREVARRVGSIIGDSASEDKRPVILVGHDLKNDLAYLQKIGYQVWRVPQCHDEVDTSCMYRRLERAQNGRGLEAICRELQRCGFDFHNAGNDAYWTLQTMIVIAFRQMLDPHKGESASAQGPEPADYSEWSEGELDDGGPPKRSQEPVRKVSPRLRPVSEHRETRW
ncbi:hypothetical protein SLS62_010227 [Diatrype stigma]|uniref:Gfd2/YDR514C-like C-terminal domain-containing protein n=1 Tax=Diatrype stigma TaxID=117547 RepID=A0AAN9UCZ7_9PEZI